MPGAMRPCAYAQARNARKLAAWTQPSAAAPFQASVPFVPSFQLRAVSKLVHTAHLS